MLNDGMIPDDQVTDTGNEPVDDFDLAALLGFGRQKHGIPAQLFANAQSRPIPPKPNTVPPGPVKFDPRDFLPGGKGTKATDDGMDSDGDQDGDTAQDQDTQAFALGGAVEPDQEQSEGGAGAPMGQAGQMMDDDAEHDEQDRFPNLAPDQERMNRFQNRERKRIEEDNWGGGTGVLPTPGKGKAPGPGSKGPDFKSYVAGADAMPPDMAASLEQRVDPTGQMDPNQRTMETLKAAGGPDQQWGLLQHYRQKFNAYNAFAQAAIQGAGGRPPNPAAAADAATKAYQNLPDGKALSFQPTNGGVRVRIQDLSGPELMKALGAGRGGANGLPPQQQYAEGGAVEEDDPETTGAIPDNAAQAAPPGDDPNAGTPVSDQGPIQSMLGGRRPDQALKDVVLSIPQFLGWLKDKGQADAVLDKGAEATLAEAQQMQGGQAPGPMAPGAAGTFPQAQQRPPQMNPNAAPPRQFTEGQSPSTPQGGFDRTPVKVPKPENYTLQDVLHEVDQQFPSVGMSQQRAAARREAIAHWMDNKAKIEAEQTKGQGALERAKVTGQFGVQRTQTAGESRLQGIDKQQTGAQKRVETSTAGKETVAKLREEGTEGRFVRGEQGKNDRTIMANQPGSIGNAAKLQKGREALGGGQAPSPQQQQGQKPPQAPPAEQRTAGQVYNTPKGPLKWTGTGWLPVNQ